jgi:hypothetical protein
MIDGEKWSPIGSEKWPILPILDHIDPRWHVKQLSAIHLTTSLAHTMAVPQKYSAQTVAAIRKRFRREWSRPGSEVTVGPGSRDAVTCILLKDFLLQLPEIS